VLGAVLLGHGLWLPAKAVLAQLLLHRAWAATDGAPVRPWPWAETWPVARLRVPALGVDQIVLAGDEGAALAFAPGHIRDSAAPGTGGNVVLAGHRDTVFAFAGRLRPGFGIELESAGGRRIHYVVTSTRVVHEREIAVLDPTDEPTLTLVTCYPLNGQRPGGSLRYVVRARALLTIDADAKSASARSGVLSQGAAVVLQPLAARGRTDCATMAR
jgi:sortase A